MFSGIAGDEQRIAMTLYTDAFVIRGHLNTRQRRVSDILNQAEDHFIVLTDVLLDEFATRTVASRAEYAQVNLDSVLFVVADTVVDAVPELRTPKVTEQALISIPPFKVTGRIHLLPERDLRSALEELTGRFLPVTDAAYWSDSIGEARLSAPMVAVNHARAQILAPHREVDPWEGLSRGPAAAVAATADAPPADADGSAKTAAPATGPDAPPVQDPWGTGTEPSAPTPAADDPWRDLGSR